MQDPQINKNSLRLAGATLNQTPLDWENNVSNILEAIHKAQLQEVDILCLPELCLTGYGCEDMFLAPWVCEKALDLLFKQIVPKVDNMAVAIGLPLIYEEKVYNCVAWCSEGRLKGIYPKQMLAFEGLHYEPRWFCAWPANTNKSIQLLGENIPIGDNLFQFSGFKIGIELCEEAWIGERRTGIRHAQNGADIILNPSASHFAFGKTHKREKIIRETRDFFKGTYVYTNLLGNEAGRVIYEGEILIGKNGKIVARNKHFSFHSTEIVVFDDQDSDSIPDISYHENKFEAFRKAEALGLFDYMRKSKSQGFSLSLSGGADSACCATLVSEMLKEGLNQLGAPIFARRSCLEKLLFKHDPKLWLFHLLNTAYQNTENSSYTTQEAAEGLAKEIGAQFHQWDVQVSIDHAIKVLSETTKSNVSWEKNDLALQNIQSRMRSPYIWLLSNLTNSLLLTTSNRSEGDVGYATMDGDTSGGLAPLAGVDKHFIRQWLIWAETELGYSSLSAINKQTPTAELRPNEAGQTDEKDLMPYSILVQIEREAIFFKKSPHDVFSSLAEKKLIDETLLKQFVKRFFTMWAHSQWKRERLAPSFHLDDFNIDPRSWFRFPILSGGFVDENKAI